MAFGGTVKLTGESEYKKALADITGNLKVLNSEMKVVTSQYDRNDKSTEALSSKNEVLNKKIDEQKQKVDVLSKALADAEQETGKNSSTSQKWQIELNNAQAELNKLVKEVGENEKSMEQSADATEENAESVEKFGKEADDSGKKALSLGDIIKANLISDAIKSGLTALANGISAVGSAMSESLTAGAEYADNILTMSTVTGVSTENLQKYNAVAELVDVSTETMTKSMAKNLKSMTSAQEGTGAMAEAYAKLGVSVTNADGSLRDGETVYWETIDALKGVTDETERDALAMELLGKSAQDLNPLIAQGSEGIKAMGDEAVEMGAVLSEDALNGLGALDDEMQRFSSITSATSNIIASAFAPEIADVIKYTNTLTQQFNKLFSAILSGQGNADEIVEEIGSAMSDVVVEMFDVVNQIVEIAPELIGAFVDILIENLPYLLESFAWMVGEVLTAISQSLDMLIPMVMMIIQAVLDTVTQNLPLILDMAMQVIQSLLNTLTQNLPTILQMGITLLVTLIQGITQSLPQLIPVIISTVVLLAETLLDNIDMLIDAGIELILALAEGLIDALPDLVDKIPVIINKLITALTNNLPKLLEMGITLLVKLGAGLIQAIPQLVAQIPQIITSLVDGFGAFMSKIGDIGGNLVSGIWEGISGSLQWIKDKIKGWVGNVTDFLKNLFGINSPSRLFKEQIGTNLALGIGEGFTDTMSDVNEDMANAIPTEFDADIHTNINGAYSSASSYESMVSAFKKALAEMKVEMNGREMGAFVTETVAREVFA